MAKVEVKNNAGIDHAAFLALRNDFLLSKKIQNKWLLRFNFSLVIATIAILVGGWVAGNYLFMIAFSIATVINFPNPKDAQQKIKDYALTVFPIIVIFLTIGVFVGILQNTGIITTLVTSMAAVLPASTGPYLYLMLAAFSVPIVILIGSDAFYFALLPLAVGLGRHFMFHRCMSPSPC